MCVMCILHVYYTSNNTTMCNIISYIVMRSSYTKGYVISDIHRRLVGGQILLGRITLWLLALMGLGVKISVESR